MTNEIWLSNLSDEKQGKPYIDARAHKEFWRTVKGVAESAIKQIDQQIIDGRFEEISHTSSCSIDKIEANQKHFIEAWEINFNKGK
jgi:hypothetical protein